MIPRIIYEKIKRDLFKGKAIILVGPTIRCTSINTSGEHNRNRRSII